MNFNLRGKRSNPPSSEKMLITSAMAPASTTLVEVMGRHITVPTEQQSHHRFSEDKQKFNKCLLMNLTFAFLFFFFSPAVFPNRITGGKHLYCLTFSASCLQYLLIYDIKLLISQSH